MSRVRFAALLLPAACLIAADDPVSSSSTSPPAWATKPAALWSQDEAKQVLTDSPWTKSLMPNIVRRTQPQYGPRPGIGRRGGIGFPGGGYPGGGYPGGGGRRYPPDQLPDDDSRASKTPDEKVPKLTVRWESALPVREAELKAHDENAPTLEDANHYAIAVYGIPANLVGADYKSLADESKKKATLSRDGKKDMKPSSVQVLRREDGPVVLFLFLKPKDKKEIITKEDRRVQFDATIGRLAFSQAFYLEDMTFQGKTEL